MAYQYPYGDTQQLNLAWFLDEFKALQEAWEQEKQGITGALDAEIARAEAALSGVIEARDQAAASAAGALAYRNAAQSASQAAELSKTNAETARRDASNYAVSAAGSAQNASNSAIAAGNSATLAESAKTTAIQQANAAVQASGAASGYAQTAGQEAANAAGSATTAGEEADRAEEAAGEVADSVTQIATNTSDINSLKESITQDEIGYIKLESGTFQDPNGIVKTANPARVRNKYILSVNRIRTIKALNGYSFWIFYIDKNYNLISSNGWAQYIDSAYFPKNTVYINFGIRKNDTPTADISNQITELENSLIIGYDTTIIAPVLSEYIADTNLVINDFRIVNNILYRVTAPIASGGTLTIGTNVVATTVADVLKSLLT